MLERVVGVLKEVAGVREVKDAKIISTGEAGSKDIMVEVTYSSRNLAVKERTLMTCNYLVCGGVEAEAASVLTFPPVTVDKNIVLRAVSERLTACVVRGPGNKGEGKTTTEGEHITLTNQDGTFRTYDLGAADKHGQVYSEPEFSCLEFSPDKTKLVYVAEKKRPKAVSFLAKAPKSNEEDTRGREYDYYNTWGEQLEGRSQSVVCVLDLVTEDIWTHTLPNELCAGQVTFLPHGKEEGKGWAVVGVAVESRPYRLGLVYCGIRDARLFHLDSEGNFELLGSAGYHIQCPRWSPDGSLLAFMRTEVGGPHAKVSQLCLLSWPDKKERVLLDVVAREKACDVGPSFRGIISSSTGLSHRCWTKDSSAIVFSTFSLDTVAPYLVSVQSGVVSGLSESDDKSRRVLDLWGDIVVLEETSMCSPGTITLMSTTHTQGRKMIQVTQRGSDGVCGLPENYLTRWTFTNPEPHPVPCYSDVPISVLYLGPTSRPQGSSKVPLIVIPHGGPHSCVANVYSAHCAFFVRLGFSVLLPNYRGSVGAGQDGVQSLPGHCGTIDVSDVYHATLSCLKRFNDVVDDSQVFLSGGSHGGFLVTHLAAQHPTIYKAVVTRNPVIDIPTMNAITDIPDWCFIETGHSFRHGLVPDAATLGKMLAASPIYHLDNIKAPFLWLVGEEDKRVPHSQAINFHKMLLARGVQTKLQLYPDCHPLSKVGVEADCLVHAALWFFSHGASTTPLSSSS